MSTVNIERPAIQRKRPDQSQEQGQGTTARERTFERVEPRVRLTAIELADAIYRPRAKIHRDFSAELARAERWLTSRNRSNAPRPSRPRSSRVSHHVHQEPR
jgi:hypothetical protein